MNTYDFLVVGAGLSGATVAERLADKGRRVLVIDKRDHIGGNCYDYEKDGMRMSKYGVHIFHTNDEEVWNYVNRFGEWVPYEHKVRAKVGDKLVPIPVNIETVNTLFDLELTEETVTIWLQNNIVENNNPNNSEEACLGRVGKDLYEMLFKPYTQKQWGKDPSELDKSILNRIPVRTSHYDRYFSDKYEALPKDGYTKVVERMLTHPNIKLSLNTDYFTLDSNVKYNKLFFTGPIDSFYAGKGLPALEYRSLKFVEEEYNVPEYQPQLVVNYPEAKYPFTRIIEYNHLPGNSKKDKTIIVKEFPTDIGEPYYPVISERNKELYEQYRKFAVQEQDTYFIGRLASYKYFNMDQAIKASLDLIREVL